MCRSCRSGPHLHLMTKAACYALLYALLNCITEGCNLHESSAKGKPIGHPATWVDNLIGLLDNVLEQKKMFVWSLVPCHPKAPPHLHRHVSDFGLQDVSSELTTKVFGVTEVAPYGQSCTSVPSSCAFGRHQRPHRHPLLLQNLVEEASKVVDPGDDSDKTDTS